MFVPPPPLSTVSTVHCLFCAVDCLPIDTKHPERWDRIRQCQKNLANCMSSDVQVVCLNGCVSIIGFREVMGKSLNVVKLEFDDDDSVDTVVREIRAEARALKYQSGNYDPGELTIGNILKQTSSTLLKLISMLVSNGTVTKQSLSLSQSIHAHITNTRYQTTFGLAVKLHHRHGSSELIKLLL